MANKKNLETIDLQIENLVEVDFENPLLFESFTSRFYSELANVEGIDEYLRLTILSDIKKYFMAADEKTRDQIRGHIAFANSIKKKVVDSRK